MARDLPWVFWTGLLAAVWIGISLGSFVWMYRVSISPTLEQLGNVELLPRGDTEAYWFVASYSTPAHAPCTRENNYILYRDDLSKDRVYYPLAGFTNGAHIEGTVQYYSILFFLPIGFPAGKWQYIVQTHYTCPPFGTVSIHDTTKPIVLDVPATKRSQTPAMLQQK